MIPKMPALIPMQYVQPIVTDLLKLKILEQIKLIASLKHALFKEQKKLEMMWKEKQKIKIKKIPARQSNIAQPKPKNQKRTMVCPGLSDTQKEFKQFRHFWSFYENFKDDEEEDDINQEFNDFSIDDLVVEDVLKYRAGNYNK